jgi:hypothetical protein
MRKAINLQLKIGETDISKIRSDLRSRDEIPKLLMGLQYIYCNPTTSFIEVTPVSFFFCVKGRRDDCSAESFLPFL